MAFQRGSTPLITSTSTVVTLNVSSGTRPTVAESQSPPVSFDAVTQPRVAPSYAYSSSISVMVSSVVTFVVALNVEFTHVWTVLLYA